MDLFHIARDEHGLTPEEIRSALLQSLEGRQLNKVLIIPPDATRYHSGAGFITCEYYKTLRARGVQVDVMPALGTHDPLTEAQAAMMYPDIPFEELLPHNWRTDVVKLGEVPGQFISDITEGLWTDSLSVEINRRVLDPSYDLILSVGQVVPHAVVGMANHSKNLFVGVGGSDMINNTHMVGAIYGLERIMGKDHTPVRQIFDYALEHYLADLPVLYVMTVTTACNMDIYTHGLFIGTGRNCLEEAIRLSEQKNIVFLPHSLRKCVTYLDPTEMHSTWIGNKAIYRTRMAMDDDSELIILAPGVEKFGEDPTIDTLIRKYGYLGREHTIHNFRKPENQDLRDNMGTTAHLIHGSHDGRFKVTYAVKKISIEEMNAVGYDAIPYDDAIKRYDPQKLVPGVNTLEDGEEIYYIPNPAIGLWISQERF